jgi:hypothetical protein
MGTLEVSIPLVSELVSATLASVAVGAMVKLFHVVRRGYLLGLPIGYSFLAIGYLLFCASYAFPELAHPTVWLALLCQSYGFVFVAVTYFLKKNGRWGHVGRWLFSTLIVLAVVVITTIVVNASLVPSYHAYAEAFRITNIILLVYILRDLYRGVRSERHGIGTTVLASYSLLGLSQYSYLIWARDGGFSSFLLGHLMEIIGLAVLAVILLEEARENR